MSLYFLAETNFNKEVIINSIVEKYSLKVKKYIFEELDKVLYLFSWKSEETVHSYAADNGDLISVVGTFFYKGLYGKPSLKLLYSDLITSKFQQQECVGHYNIILKTQSGISIYNDLLGSWRIYRSQNGYISSSFYLLLEVEQNLTFNNQGVYEYILNDCTFGEKTVVNQISSIAPDKILSLSKKGKITYSDVEPSLLKQMDNSHASMEELVEDYSARLEQLFTTYKQLPNQAFRSALSGGFDSRLILSCFLKVGITPELYVYGKDTDQDVIVAKNVAKTAGLDLDFIDKSTIPDNINDNNYASIIDRNLFMYDGLPNYGIFNNGNDYYDRTNRSKGGKVLVNGSVGEIFRHFYYWPNKKIKTSDFVKSFHSRFDSQNMTGNFDFNTYSRNISDEVKKSLGTDKDLLDREELEMLYPLFRARYWSARDTVNNHRFGLSLYPFFEYNLINGSSSINFDKKLYGRFEAKLIEKMTPDIASCMSDYGFSFDSEIPMGYKIKTQAFTYHRPVWLRYLSYTVKNRLNKKPVDMVFSKDYISELINIEFPSMSKYFNGIENLDLESRNRLMTLEYISKKYTIL